jgi:hypothetical protein
MDSVESIQFDLADGTSVAVESRDYRRVYEGLWKLSGMPGAISAARLLLGATRRPGYPRAVELDAVQSAALKSAISRSNPRGVAGDASTPRAAG